MNIEHEQQFLGCLFLMAMRDMNPDDIAITLSGLEPDDFSQHQNRAIFSAIKRRAETGQSFDTTLIIEDCGEKVDVGYTFEIARNATSTANATEYKRLVKQASVKRQALSLTNQIADMIHNEPDPIQTLGMAESMIQQLMGKSSIHDSGFVHISKMMRDYIDETQLRLENPNAVKGIKTGINCFDDRLEDGIQAGSLIVMGGRPGMGKTALMLSLIRGMTESDTSKSTYCYSLEMSLPQIMKRYATFYTGRSYDGMLEDMKRDPDGMMWAKLAQMAEQNSHLPIYMKDTANLTIEQVCADIRKKHRENPVGLIALDYLTLMKIPQADRRDIGIGEVTRSLKNLAKELGCVVLLLAQLNRGVESRNNKRALPSDFRDSGSIEQDADYIITLYRDAVYNEDSEMESIGEVDWCKVRHGSTFRAFMDFKNGLWLDTIDQPAAHERMKRSMTPKRVERKFADGI